MLTRLAFAVVLLAGFAALTLRDAPPAQAVFHCMRIHAVMAGANGDTSIQYVELRMPIVFQTSVNGTQLRFFNAAGTQTGTFTLGILSITNTAAGSSILIGSDDPSTPLVNEFQDAFGITPDFTMDPDVLAPSGKVQFTGAFDCLAPLDPVIDSVAYGSFTGTVDCPEPPATPGPPASALPTTGVQALTLNNLNSQCGTNPGDNNSTEYSLQTAAPRNNAGDIGAFLPTDTDGDGVPNASDLCPDTMVAAVVDANGCSQAQVDGDLDGDCDPGQASPLWCTGSDPCPAEDNYFTGTLPPWSIDGATDVDCDGFRTAFEVASGTDPNVACGVGAWLPDTNDDLFVNITDVNSLRPPVFNLLLGRDTIPTNPSYEQRKDFNDDGFINITDVNAMRPPIFNLLTACTP